MECWVVEKGVAVSGGVSGVKTSTCGTFSAVQTPERWDKRKSCTSSEGLLSSKEVRALGC